MRRLVAYGLLSTGLTGSVIVNAVRSRPNFFAAAVALGKSSGSLMVSHYPPAKVDSFLRCTGS